MVPICSNCHSRGLNTIFLAPAFDSCSDNTGEIFNVSRCRNCKLVVTVGANPMVVSASYDASYYGAGQSKFIPAIEWVVSKQARFTAGRILRHWQRSRPAQKVASVLDIGCGRGVLLNAFRGLGANALGLERSQFPLDDSTFGFIETGNLSDARYNGKKFDIIILWHVLEHMEEPENLLQTIADHMEDYGTLVINVPNFSSFQRNLFKQHWFHLDLPRHVIHIEPAWLTEALRRCGFHVESTNFLDPLQSNYGFIQSSLNRLFPGRLNELYYLLKHPRHVRKGRVFTTLGWLVLAALLTPLALLEMTVSLILRRSSTIEVVARFRGNNDQE